MTNGGLAKGIPKKLWVRPPNVPVNTPLSRVTFGPMRVSEAMTMGTTWATKRRFRMVSIVTLPNEARGHKWSVYIPQAVLELPVKSSRRSPSKKSAHKRLRLELNETAMNSVRLHSLIDISCSKNSTNPDVKHEKVWGLPFMKRELETWKRE